MARELRVHDEMGKWQTLLWWAKQSVQLIRSRYNTRYAVALHQYIEGDALETYLIFSGNDVDTCRANSNPISWTGIMGSIPIPDLSEGYVVRTLWFRVA